MKPEEIKNIIEQHLSIDIFKKTRSRTHTDARAVYYGLVREYNPEMASKDIGEPMKHDPSTVSHSINTTLPGLEFANAKMHKLYLTIIEENQKPRDVTMYKTWTPLQNYKVGDHLILADGTEVIIKPVSSVKKKYLNQENYERPNKKSS